MDRRGWVLALVVSPLVAACTNAGGDDTSQEPGSTIRGEREGGAAATGGPVECESDADCDDGIACTVERCELQTIIQANGTTMQGRCSYEPRQSACDPGTFCLEFRGCVATTVCANDDDCSDEDACTEFERCDPATRTCRYALLDGDHDGNPPLVCGGTDCNDASFDNSETCNGVDDDCDGEIDEGFDLQNDYYNCGRCGVMCSAPSCVEGECTRCGAVGEECCGGSGCLFGAACEDGHCREVSADPTPSAVEPEAEDPIPAPAAQPATSSQPDAGPPAPTAPPPAPVPSSPESPNPETPVPSMACDQSCASGVCTLSVPVVYRDFGVVHPDFGPIDGACLREVEDTGDVVSADALSIGLVAASLGPGQVPILVEEIGLQRCEVGADKASYSAIWQFGDWFTDGADRATLERELLLYPSDEGSYVNRYGDDGAQWTGHENEEWADSGEFVCSWCLDGDCEDRCDADVVQFDGTPVFFPLDDVVGPTSDILPAKIPAQYGYLAWPWESDVVDSSIEHNHYFTSVFSIAPVFDATSPTAFELEVGDDAWLFVNGSLALDLGGRHVPERGSVSIDATTASSYGLVDGEPYEVLIFHANRNGESSSLRLRVTGARGLATRCVE